MSSASPLPPVTIVIEWENAIDVHDEWTAKAMSALQTELGSVAGEAIEQPRLMYLYNKDTVDPAVIRRMMEVAAPRLEEFARVELVPTAGLTYYRLKNFGVSRSTTDLTVMLDSDAAPQPGWLRSLLAPFADPSIMVVGGFTVLGYEDLVSKTMALSWIFDLPSERKQAIQPRKFHANNFAVRTAAIRDTPIPELPIFKKQWGFWLRDLDARGYRYIRIADAMTIHAPHPGLKYLSFRAWMSGCDLDYMVFHEKSRWRIVRIGRIILFMIGKTAKSWSRIITKGGEVELPVWQRPFAMGLAFGYYAIVAAGGLVSALTRRYDPLPKRPNRSDRVTPGQVGELSQNV